MSLLFALFLIILGGTALLAAARGGRYERLGTAAVVVAAVMSPFLQAHSYAEPEAGILIIDTALFIALAMIAMRATTFWPIWAAGFQLCGLAAHFAAAKLPTMLPAIYAQTLAIWAFPVLFALMAGIWLECRVQHGRG